MLLHILTDRMKQERRELFLVFEEGRAVKLSEIIASKDPNMFQAPEVLQEIVRDPKVVQAAFGIPAP